MQHTTPAVVDFKARNPNHLLANREKRIEAPVPPAVYSIPQVIEATGLCRDTIYRAIRAGRLIARKYGKRTLVLPADLDQFLASLPRL